MGFVLWAIFAMSWLANSVRTRGVDEDTLRGNQDLSVLSDATGLTFLPASTDRRTGLVFICGSGAEACAPLLRPVAEAGFPVSVVRLPYRFAPLESHKRQALSRVRQVIEAHPEVTNWVIGGHSLGGALAARLARSDARAVSGLVLIATTHPKDDDLSFLRIPVTKIFASNDGVAPRHQVLANRGLLPPETTWVELTRSAILHALAEAGEPQIGRAGR